MKLSHFCLLAAAGMASVVSFTGCDSGKSYADLLTEETHAVNYYLANHRVVNEIPADTVLNMGKMHRIIVLTRTATCICRLSIQAHPTIRLRMMN